MKEKAIFNWSGGKDSAFSLYKVWQAQQYEVMCLLTSISQQYQRISMHGVRVDLLESQVASIGLPLAKMELPDMPSMESYEQMMHSTLTEWKQRGASASIFGDIFLEDLRQYRESKLALLDLKGVFPLWKMPTDRLIHEFLDAGFQTVVTCVNEQYLDKSFAGRVIDRDFINDLPKNVDPCGENGEFHTFVFDGPIFQHPIPFKTGEVVYRKYTSAKSQDSAASDCYKEEEPFAYGFWYCDLLLAAAETVLNPVTLSE
jgi:uncharacterized protein (TIGR00290 family)